jgi:hypothetical protein
MYYETVQQFKKMLFNLANHIDKAVQHAETKKFDIGNILNSRLAPDQFNFIRQVQVACDTSKGFAARLAGQEAPKHEDTETSVDELKARIKKVSDYLDTFPQDAFAGSGDRKIELPFILPGHYITGEEYTIEFAVPNFYFHISTAYEILRHNGVEIGKRDFIGHVNFKPV